MKKIIKALLDENNNSNIILEFDGVEIEFEQIALVENRMNFYVILRPITVMEGINNDEGYVFLVDDVKNQIITIEDDEVVAEVFEIYEALLEE